MKLPCRSGADRNSQVETSRGVGSREACSDPAKRLDSNGFLDEMITTEPLDAKSPKALAIPLTKNDTIRSNVAMYVSLRFHSGHLQRVQTSAYSDLTIATPYEVQPCVTTCHGLFQTPILLRGSETMTPLLRLMLAFAACLTLAVSSPVPRASSAVDNELATSESKPEKRPSSSATSECEVLSIGDETFGRIYEGYGSAFDTCRLL